MYVYLGTPAVMYYVVRVPDLASEFVCTIMPE